MSVKSFFPRSTDLFGQAPSTAFDASLPEILVGDPDGCNVPIDDFLADHVARTMPEALVDTESTEVPPKPEDFPETAWLQPSLTRNEYMRLTTLWYHARDALKNPDLVTSIKAKVDLVREFFGWDAALCGLLDMDSFVRGITSGIPEALIPRRESTCSHTLQIEGNVFQSSDMSEDWRFKNSPAVAQGGLRSYAGAPIRCNLDNGESVAIGSLCVVSSTPGKILDPAQKATLARFANLVMSDIVAQSRAQRRAQQVRMNELLVLLSTISDPDELEARTLAMISDIYPEAEVNIRLMQNGSVRLSGGRQVAITDCENGLWEDTLKIKEIITTENQHIPTKKITLRALIGVLRFSGQRKALVIETKDLRQVFDEIDSWFVERCASVLTNVAQERSLKEARLAKERFLRGITHQLRTPIHGILGSVDLLVEDLSARQLLGAQTPVIEYTEYFTKDSALDVVHGAASDDAGVNTAEVLRTIRNSGRELMSTVNNILRLNKWGQLAQQMDRSTSYDLRDFEESVLADTRRLIPDNELDSLILYFDNKLPPGLTVTTLNVDLIRECVEALLINALLFTDLGCVVVTLSCPEDKSALVVDIEDTGRGIKLENHARIFEDYEKEDTHTRGAGLGLTLASKIASGMDGTVELVASEPGKGSHFRLTLPRPELSQASDLVPTVKRPGLGEPLMDSFTTIPAKATDCAVVRFTEYLERRGMSKSSVHFGALTVLSYDPKPLVFRRHLEEAKLVSGPIVCLVPAQLKTSKLRKEYPNIFFFKGPFTSSRVRSIFASLNDPTMERKQSVAHNMRLSPPHSDESAVSPVLAIELENKLKIQTCARRTCKQNVLLVDDNEINLRIFKMWCNKRSYDQRQAVDGLFAIEQYTAALTDSHPISLILLDLQMPRCDGIEACAAIRKIEQDRGLQPAVIFIVTGQDDPRDREKALLAGANEFYVKPMGIKMLDQALSQYFET